MLGNDNGCSTSCLIVVAVQSIVVVIAYRNDRNRVVDCELIRSYCASCKGFAITNIIGQISVCNIKGVITICGILDGCSPLRIIQIPGTGIGLGKLGNNRNNFVGVGDGNYYILRIKITFSNNNRRSSVILKEGIAVCRVVVVRNKDGRLCNVDLNSNGLIRTVHGVILSIYDDFDIIAIVQFGINGNASGPGLKEIFLLRIVLSKLIQRLVLTALGYFAHILYFVPNLLETGVGAADQRIDNLDVNLNIAIVNTVYGLFRLYRYYRGNRLLKRCIVVNDQAIGTDIGVVACEIRNLDVNSKLLIRSNLQLREFAPGCYFVKVFRCKSSYTIAGCSCFNLVVFNRCDRSRSCIIGSTGNRNFFLRPEAKGKRISEFVPLGFTAFRGSGLHGTGRSGCVNCKVECGNGSFGLFYAFIRITGFISIGNRPGIVCILLKEDGCSMSCFIRALVVIYSRPCANGICILNRITLGIDCIDDDTLGSCSCIKVMVSFGNSYRSSTLIIKVCIAVIIPVVIKLDADNGRSNINVQSDRFNAFIAGIIDSLYINNDIAAVIERLIYSNRTIPVFDKVFLCRIFNFKGKEVAFLRLNIVVLDPVVNSFNAGIRFYILDLNINHHIGILVIQAVLTTCICSSIIEAICCRRGQRNTTCFLIYNVAVRIDVSIVSSIVGDLEVYNKLPIVLNAVVRIRLESFFIKILSSQHNRIASFKVFNNIRACCVVSSCCNFSLDIAIQTECQNIEKLIPSVCIYRYGAGRNCFVHSKAIRRIRGFDLDVFHRIICFVCVSKRPCIIAVLIKGYGRSMLIALACPGANCNIISGQLNRMPLGINRREGNSIRCSVFIERGCSVDNRNGGSSCFAIIAMAIDYFIRRISEINGSSKLIDVNRKNNGFFILVAGVIDDLDRHLDIVMIILCGFNGNVSAPFRLKLIVGRIFSFKCIECAFLGFLTILLNGVCN